MKRIFILIIFFILFQNTASSYPQFDEEKNNPEIEIQKQFHEPIIHISLQECIDIALQNNLDIKISSTNFRASEWDYKNSLSAFLPNVSLSGYTTRYRGQLLVGGALTDEINELAIYGGVNITHDLTQGGKTIFEASRKNKLKKMYEKKYNMSESEVLYNTIVNYYKLLEAKLVIESTLRDYNEREIEYEITKAQYEVGEMEQFDKLRAELELIDAKKNINTTLNAYILAQAKLCLTMNVSVMNPLVPTENKINIHKFLDDSETIESAYQKALNTRNKIKALQYEISALKTQRASVYSDFIPNASLNFNYTYQGTVNKGIYPNTTMGLNITIPLGKNLGVGTITKLKYYDEQIKGKELELEREKLTIHNNIYTSFYNSDIYFKQVNLIKEEIKLTTKVQQIAQAKLLEGAIIFVDVTNAQTEKTKKEIELSRAIINYNTSQIDILFHSGMLTKKIILENYTP